jgi:hypothetical protein
VRNPPQCACLIGVGIVASDETGAPEIV